MFKILLGGSPCTHWSIARPNDRETVSSGIGWELFENYDIAKEKFKPDVFLYENVASMSDDIRKEITKTFNCEPSRVDGKDFSAAERDRLWWHNFGELPKPPKCDLVLEDILQHDVPEKYFYSYPLENININKQVCATMVFKNNDMHKRVFNPKFKVHTLTTCGGGNTQKKVYIDGRARKLTPTEYERCMTLPDGYTEGVADTHRYTMCGNGWTAEVAKFILSHGLREVPRDEEIVVVSMYDGLGTGRYVLDKLGFTNIKYYAFEIEPNAIKIANKNYPEIIQCGDAFAVRAEQWAGII